MYLLKVYLLKVRKLIFPPDRQSPEIAADRVTKFWLWRRKPRHSSTIFWKIRSLPPQDTEDKWSLFQQNYYLKVWSHHHVQQSSSTIFSFQPVLGVKIPSDHIFVVKSVEIIQQENSCICHNPFIITTQSHSMLDWNFKRKRGKRSPSKKT